MEAKGMFIDSFSWDSLKAALDFARRICRRK